MAPRWVAKMHARSHSIAELKIAIPAPSGPSRCDSGTRQSSNTTSPIGDVRRPIFSIGLLKDIPFVPRGTRNAVSAFGLPSCERSR